MAGWVIKTEFMTDTSLENGNWSAVMFDTEAEALTWWNASDVRSSYTKQLTLTSPDGKVVDQRVVR